MDKKEILQLLFLAGTTVIVRGQTVSNTGILHINPGTTVGVAAALDNREAGILWNDGELYLFSNFNNDGLVSFAPGEKGITRFEGKVKQKISGTMPAEFKNVLFNNISAESALALSSEITIEGTADFTRGIVSSESEGGFMVFEADGSAVNTSDKSYAQGNVKRNGQNAFVYPVGDKGFYRPSAIQATNDALSSFTSSYVYENSDPDYPHAAKSDAIEKIDDREYWKLEKDKGSADAVITLSWDETTTTPGDILTSPEERLHIVSWDEGQKQWVDQGGVVDTANKTVTTPASVTGSTIFTFARMKDKASPCNNLLVYNAVSPNGDGKNDFFKIDGLDGCSESSNSVQIFNRWGVKVFETENYGANGNVFRGYSEGRTTVSKAEQLPSGTYFYIIDFRYKGADNSPQMMKKSGYLYIN